MDLARDTVRAFTRALALAGIHAPLYLTQNDGTVTAAEHAEDLPVFSFASGPTNSMRGAAFLSGLGEAMVIDVGGTTTDVGAIRHGFPREANNVIEVGGVRTLFRMPDLLSIALGGGAIVRTEPFRAGPESVAYQLTQRARVSGGADLTCTDIGVALGLIELGDRARLADVSGDLLGAPFLHDGDHARGPGTLELLDLEATGALAEPEVSIERPPTQSGPERSQRNPKRIPLTRSTASAMMPHSPRVTVRASPARSVRGFWQVGARRI